MKTVRFGIIGMGDAGMMHAKDIISGIISRGELTAICDNNKNTLKEAGKTLKIKDIDCYTDAESIINSGKIDAVIVSCPHYLHTDYAIKSLQNNLHVMVEAPAGVYTKQVKLLNEVALNSQCKFGIMFPLRYNNIYLKLKEVLHSGKLGSIKRINIISTDFYRSQAYYDKSSWRGTWKNAGGGVLLDHFIHVLDYLQWLFDRQPCKICALCQEGRNRHIEVEDEAAAYIEYDNNITGVISVSSTDCSGTNRFEIQGTNGRLLMDNNKLTFFKAEIPEDEFNKYNMFPLRTLKQETINIECDIISETSAYILNNFCNSILYEEPLLIPGKEGLKSLAVANAMLLSSWIGKSVVLPIDEDLFYKKLKEKCNC